MADVAMFYSKKYEVLFTISFVLVLVLCDTQTPDNTIVDFDQRSDGTEQHFEDLDEEYASTPHEMKHSDSIDGDAGVVNDANSFPIDENNQNMEDSENVVDTHAKINSLSKWSSEMFQVVWDYVSGLVDNFIEEFFSSITKRDIEPVNEKEETVELSLVVPLEVAENQTDIPDTDLKIINTTDELGLTGELINETNVINKTEGKTYKFNCVPKNLTENETASVKIVNGSMLLSVLRRGQNSSVEGVCVLVLFYAPWCPFCAKLAPHYNALGRAFMQLDILAVNAMDFSYLNVQFGTVAVPHIILFRSSRPVMRFNNTQRTYDNLASFIVNMTGLQANSSVNITDMDYFGPLSAVATRKTDFLLILAWVFVVICAFYTVTVSHVGQRMINQVRILWHEHQHID